MAKDRKDWIDDVELEDVVVKWAWSNFDGREDRFNEAGAHHFTIILPDDVAEDLASKEWPIKEAPPYEEGDLPEQLLKIKISYKYEPPKIFLLKENSSGEMKKFRADERDLADIRRDTCERLDVIITPYRWVNGRNTGVSAYAKELYAVVKESRFARKYQDFEEV